MALHHVSSLKPNDVSPNLRAGTFALKWSEETNKPWTPIAVYLSVDPKGFYFICLNKITKESECFDITLIHDTRTGSEVSLPRSAADCEQMNIGNKDDPILSKWLTIYYGNTFIPDRDLRVIHFAFQSTAFAREWAEKLFQYGHNPLLRNLSSLDCLEKIHSRIVNGLVEDRFDKKAISIRNLIQFLCKYKSDSNKEAKILKALELLELPCRLDIFMDPDQFTFNKFVRFYMQLMERHEIDKLFDATGGKHRRYLGWEKVKDFIVKQNDARGGAFGMDYYDQKAKDLVKKYTQHDVNFMQRGMNDESFLRYLLSFDNFIVDPAKYDLCMDMDKPLAHYFIASSHNTYLTGSQLTGRASTEIYRQVLLTGCRCVELDVVDSEKNDEPEIKHKNTPVRPVPFLQAIIAIRECAFKVSPYPVILSLENHCSPRVQAKMAQYLVDILGDNLVTQPLKSHPIEDNRPLPSPNDLKYKILVKNKKLHSSTVQKLDIPYELASLQQLDSTITTTATTIISDQNSVLSTTTTTSTQSCPSNVSNDNGSCKQTVPYEFRHGSQSIESDPQLVNGNNRNMGLVDDDDSLSDDDDILPSTTNNLENDDLNINLNTTENLLSDQTITMINNQSNLINSNAKTESKATKAMSDLVHYIVPVRFINFTRSEERNRSYEISSFGEEKAQTLIHDYAREFVAYNQRQLSRIYPRGTRFDSSNYNPYLFWPVGCQMVALNYQTLDIPMQVNLGLFSFNGGCGYLEKPASLCQSTGSFDPKGRFSVENVVGYQIDIKIISGQFLCQDREPTYVDVEMYGLYADATKRNEYRLHAKRWNGFQAVYDDTDVETGEYSIRFSKVILPEMAALRFAVSEEDGTFVGQSFIPVAHLRPGYRHVVLRNQIHVPVQSSSLFIYIRKDVHVDADIKDLADQLVSPKTAPSVMKEQQQQQQQQRVKPNKKKTLSEQRSQSFGDLNTIRKNSNDETVSSSHHVNFSSDIPLRYHYPSTTEIDTGAEIHNKKRNLSTTIIDANWYRNQLIASSQFHDEKHLFKEVSLEDLEETKSFKRKRENIEAKTRRLALEYEKKIQYEEERFQKCLYLQSNGMNALLEKSVDHWNGSQGSTSTSSQLDARTSSFVHERFISDEVKLAETRLLDLYSSKFHSQNEVEYKLSKEYHNELEKYVNDYYTKQLQQINNILKHEQSKVKEDVRIQMRTETKRTIMTETDREKIANLKEKIRQLNIEAGALAVRKLQEMHEQLEKKIRTNLQKTLHQLHEKKDNETKNRFTTYSNQLNEVKFRLQRDINGMTYHSARDNSLSMPYRSTITSSASLSAIADHHPLPTSSLNIAALAIAPNLLPRRQTINNPGVINSPLDHEEFIGYLNQTTESTRL